MTGRQRILAMIDGQAVDHLPLMPITMMFAADVAGEKYGTYARDHRVLADAQFRTAEAFGFDYVSAISDPAREVADLGGAVGWFEDQPPAVVESRALLEDKSRLAGLKLPDMTRDGRMRDRIEAVRLLRQKVGDDRVVEGWVEGPCAMAADLRGLNTLMLDFHDDPDFVAQLLDFVVTMETAFAEAQVEAGADVIGVGDAAASLIGPRLYETFIVRRERQLVAAIKAVGARVRLHICGNTRKIVGGMGTLGCDIVDLDFPCPIHEARSAMGPDQVLLGNLDPVRVVRDGTPESIGRELSRCFEEAGSRYIVGAGCEIPRGTPEANLRALADFARSHRT
ncbi:uroporphyrinogen decarboxylase family protein [Aquisphaera insulae]|uniref:uroporphyrinogen decarboxylase family protein n=1 Tax=Aquisphaera insulae TaxID=2712864 RepID=UPI0013EA4EC4|nr:uroporphyrinogen decarboxylase family protein [Aquisphaera insulae]